MGDFADAFVWITRVVLLAGLAWGGWLCIGELELPENREKGFEIERFASFALLVLLITTIGGFSMQAELAALLKNADPAERRWLGRQLANVLAALPTAQDELSAQPEQATLPRLKELARQVAMLETVLLELAR